MKNAFYAFLLCFFVLFQTWAADEPKIPTLLKKVIPGIHPGMTVHEVETVLSTSYPKVKASGGCWSGGSGCICFLLSRRYFLVVSFVTRDGEDVVHDDMAMSLCDMRSNPPVGIKISGMEKQLPKAPSPK